MDKDFHNARAGASSWEGEAREGEPRPGGVGGDPGAAPGGAVRPVPGSGAEPRGRGHENAADSAPWKDREQRNPPPVTNGARPASEGSRSYRAEVFALRDGLRAYAPAIGQPGGRVRACGRVRHGSEVAIVERGDRRHFCGLVRCGSVWTCPCCSAQIRAERAGEVQKVVSWHCDTAGADGAQLLTLTVRHRYGDDLADLRHGLADAYRRFTRGVPWERFRERVGLVGYVRAVEVTHGGNGWHPHLHVVLLVRDGEALARELDWLRERWQACVVRELGAAAEPDALHGVDLRARHRADYLTKLGLEATAPGAKGARGENRTPWEIAADLVENAHGEEQREEDRHLWRTWCEDMRGAKMLTWSRGLRAAAGLDEDEKSDEDIVQGERGRTTARLPASRARRGTSCGTGRAFRRNSWRLPRRKARRGLRASWNGSRMGPRVESSPASSASSRSTRWTPASSASSPAGHPVVPVFYVGASG